MPDDSRDDSGTIRRRLNPPLLCSLPNQNPDPHGNAGKRHVTIWTFSEGRPIRVYETEQVSFNFADPEGADSAPPPAKCSELNPFHPEQTQLVRPMLIEFPHQFEPLGKSNASQLKVTIYTMHFEKVTIVEGQKITAFCWDDDEDPPLDEIGK
jgi:hypothetical protein